MTLSEHLSHALTNEIAFSIPIGSFQLDIPKTTVTQWIIMAVLILLAFIFTRNLKVVPTGKQALLETFLEMLYKLFYGVLGEHGKKYIPYMMTLIIFIGSSNIMGIFHMAPPTKNINATAALAVMSIVLIQYASIKHRGVGGWLKHFGHPNKIVTPLNVFELVIKPFSLCMRLFGNILGAFIVMELIIYCIPVGVPAVFSLYFDLFDGLLQAYIFCFLTSLYISEAIED